MIIEKKYDKVLCLRSFSTLYTQGVKVHPGILKNSF